MDSDMTSLEVAAGNLALLELHRTSPVNDEGNLIDPIVNANNTESSSQRDERIESQLNEVVAELIKVKRTRSDIETSEAKKQKLLHPEKDVNTSKDGNNQEQKKKLGAQKKDILKVKIRRRQPPVAERLAQFRYSEKENEETPVKKDTQKPAESSFNWEDFLNNKKRRWIQPRTEGVQTEE